MNYKGLIGISNFDVGRSRSIRRQLLYMVLGIILGFCTAYFLISSNGDSQQDIVNNGILTEELYNEVRVLCWIMTSPNNHYYKAIHVQRTWGKRCNKLLFMSSAEDETIGSIALNISEGRDHLWAKTKEAFKYIYKHHFHEADWFLKADDDTYTVVENLRLLLYPYSPESPIYFGSKFKDPVSGGAGYVLSKEAVRRFVEDAIPNSEICKSGTDDSGIGLCLQNVNVMEGDSRDREGCDPFFSFTPEQHLLADKGNLFKYWKNIYDGRAVDLNICWNNAISFHNILYYQMYVYDYLLYHLRVFGRAIPAEV